MTANTQSFKKAQSLLLFPLVLIVVLFGLSFLGQVQRNERLVEAFWVASAALFVAWIVLCVTVVYYKRVLELKVVIRKAHYVQAILQCCIYGYWGFYWEEVGGHVWLIVAQIVYVYAFDMIFAWSRRREWSLGFGQFPVILSTNLFIWFRDDWFLLQFLLVTIGVLGKECIRWQRDGRSVHIFNPSGFSLSVMSLALILTGMHEISWGLEISETLRMPPYMFYEIFLMGMIVQFLFSVTLTTLSSGVVIFGFCLVYKWITGVYFFTSGSVPIAVFIGFHLLVTDPVTSPRTGIGRVIFGAAYGAIVLLLYHLLSIWGIHPFYDKILPIPLLNLSVRLFDRIGSHPCWDVFQQGSLGERFIGKIVSQNLFHMGLWLLVFLSAVGATDLISRKEQVGSLDFWREACARGDRNACERYISQLDQACYYKEWDACVELGLVNMEGKIVKRNMASARELFNIACENGSALGCEQRAFLKRWSAQNIALLEEECQAGNGESCFAAADVYLMGADGIPKDIKKARALYEAACAHGFEGACHLLERLRQREAAAAKD